MPDLFSKITKFTPVFLEVAKTHSLTVAARNLNYSKGRISQELTELETVLQTQLVDRSRRPLILTPEGGLLYKTLIGQSQELRTVVDQIQAQSNQKPTVRIGFIESLYLSIGTQFCESLAEETQSLTFTFGSAWELEKLLFEKRLDFATSWFPFENSSYVNLPILAQKILLAVPKNTLLPSLNKDSIEGTFRTLCFSGLPMITHPNFIFSSNSSSAIMEASGYKLFRKFNVDGIQLQLELVAKKLGFCLTQPICFVGREDLLDKINLYPIKGLKRIIYLVHNRDESKGQVMLVTKYLADLLNKSISPSLQLIFEKSSIGWNKNLFSVEI